MSLSTLSNVLSTRSNANFDVLQSEINECLALILEPKQYSDQKFYYKAADIFFKYQQQAYRQLKIADGAKDAESIAISEAKMFATVIMNELVNLALKQVVRYSIQPDQGENVQTQPIPTVLLKGDLLMWQQTSNFLHFFDQASFWLPAHQLFESQYNEIVVRMLIFMLDCAPSLVVQIRSNNEYSMKQPEGWIWVDLYNNLQNLHINLESNELGEAVRSVYEYYKPAFFRSMLHDQQMFRAMKRMLVDHLSREYLPNSNLASNKEIATVSENVASSKDEHVIDMTKLDTNKEIATVSENVASSKDEHVIDMTKLDIHTESHEDTATDDPIQWWYTKHDNIRMFKDCDNNYIDLYELYKERRYEPSCDVCMDYADPNYYKWKAKNQEHYKALNEDRGPEEKDNVVDYVASMKVEGNVLTEFPDIEPAYPCFQCTKLTHLHCKLHIGQRGLPQKCWGCNKHGFVKNPVRLPNFNQILNMFKA